MNRLQLDGAVYCFALPDGGCGALFPGSHIQTSEGRVELPGEDVLGLVGTRWQGRLCMAGQGQQTGQAWLWTGRWTATGLTFGVSPCAFGGGFLFTVASGASYRRLNLVTGETIEIAAQIGTQGIRYVDGEAPVSGDATYRNGELFEWTRREDLVCGQGHLGGALLNGMELEPGDCRFIRFERAGEKLGIGIVKLVERCAVLHFLSVAELQERPPKPDPGSRIPEPWKVRIAGWDPVIARGVSSKVRAGLGNGVEVEWSKDANDNIHIAVYKDGELQDRSAAPRHVEVKG